MALSNAERQRRWREKRKAQLASLGDVAPVERPSGTLHNIKSQPQRVQQLYKVADYMLTIGETVEKATEQVRVDGIAQEHIEYARYVTTEAERRLRELRERINS